MSNKKYIVNLLKTGEKTKSEIAKQFMMTWQEVETHLKELMQKSVILEKKKVFPTIITYELNTDFNWKDAIHSLSGMMYRPFAYTPNYWNELIGVNPEEFPEYFDVHNGKVALSEKTVKLLKDESANTQYHFNMLTERIDGI